VGALAGNIDLAPTIEAWAGADRSPATDGRSLAPLLRSGTVPDDWRTRFLVEHWQEEKSTESSGPTEPADLDATKLKGHGSAKGVIDDQSLLDRFGKIPSYSAIRTPRYLYAEYSTGEKELYDLRKDPDETTNLARRVPTARERSLAQKLDALRTCHDQACRDADHAGPNGP
jgi:arylsulfatase A-like enzyme